MKSSTPPPLGKFIPSLLIALSIVILGLCLKSGIDNFTFRDREVTVRGLAERQVMANEVTWPITINIAGDDLTPLYDTVHRTDSIIVRFLTSSGITRDEISVDPQSKNKTAANQYGSSTFKYKYSLESTVTVTTKKVDKVRELLGRQAELLKEGVAFSNSYINYRYTDLNAIKPAMIEEATKNARLAADKFAADSHSKVGKIKTASQGQFTIDDSDSSTPWLKNVRVVSTIVYYIED